MSFLFPFLTLFGFASLFILSLLMTEFLTCWVEEKILARIEMRKSLSLKKLFCKRLVLLFKRFSDSKDVQKTLFNLAPVCAFVLALFFFFFLPLGKAYFFHSEFSLLYLLFATSVGMYCFITGGWASGTRFSFFGAIRMIAQSLACQPLFAIILITIAMSAGGADLYTVIEAQKKMWFILPHFPLFVLYLLACFMLLSYPPFGSPKAKRELAGGVYAEYSGALWLFFLIAENLFLMLCSAVGVVLFLGGDLPLFLSFKGAFLVSFLIKMFSLIALLTLMKNALPNWKIGHVMNKSFQVFIPFAFLWLMGTACVLFLLQGGK